MGFDNDYPNRKDKRKKYRRSKAIDTSCRNHGSCAWCASGRLHKQIAAAIKATEELKQFLTGG